MDLFNIMEEANKNIAPLKYLLEGMEVDEARAKVLAEEGKAKGKI